MNNQLSSDQIFERVSDIIREALRVDKSKIVSEARIFNDLGAESLDILDIRFNLEEEFGFKIQDNDMIRYLGKELSREEIMEFFTVGKITEYVKLRLEEK